MESRDRPHRRRPRNEEVGERSGSCAVGCSRWREFRFRSIGGGIQDTDVHFLRPFTGKRLIEGTVEYLIEADIDPEHLANFMFRLSQEDEAFPEFLEWVSTHPDSRDRSADILELRNESGKTEFGTLATEEGGMP